MEFLWLATILLFWILILFGLPHLTFRSECRKELRNQGKSPTSNSRKPFLLKIERYEKHLGKLIVEGTAKGASPSPGDVVYLVDRESRTPVVIRRIRALDMDKEGKGDSCRIVLFGAGKQTPGSKACLTNQRERPKEASVEKEPISISYPVTVACRVREILPFAVVFAVGLLALCLILYAGTSKKGDALGLTLLGIGAAFLLLIGLTGLLDLTSFRLILESEDQLRIRRFFRETVYHVNNLKARAFMPADQREIWRLELTNAAGVKVAEINDTEAGYDAVSEVFRQANARRKEKELHRYLKEKLFYIPAHMMGDSEEEQQALPTLMINTETNTPSIFLFDNESVLTNNLPKEYDAVIETRLEDAIPYLDRYQSTRMLVLLSDPRFPAMVEIDRELWQKINDIA